MDSPPNHSIRRRQVDIDKPLQIIWQKHEDTKNQADRIEKLLGSTKTKPLTDEAKKQNYQNLESQTCKESLKSSMGEVETPSFRPISPYKDKGTFSRPVSYIHFYESPYDFEEITYQLDDQDDDFLNLWNSKVKEKSLQISDDKFEEIITLLENLTFKNYDKVKLSDHILEQKKQSKSKRNHNNNNNLQRDLEDFENSIKNSSYKLTTKKALQKLYEEFINLQGATCQACFKVKENQSGVIDNRFIRCSICKITCHKSCYFSEKNKQIQKTTKKTRKRRNSKKTTTITSISPQFIQTNWKCDKCLAVPNKKKGKQAKCCLCYHSEGLLRSVVDEDKEFGSFAHLICAKWIEETSCQSYEENGKIDGIRNISSDKYESICKFCKKEGVCISCTASNCKHLYHPYCAQIANCSMENKIFYCSKHTSEIKEEHDSKHKYSMLSIEHLELLAPIVKKTARDTLQLSDIIFDAIFYYWKCKRFKVRSFLIPSLNKMLEEDQEIADQTKKSKKKRTEEDSLQAIINMRKDLECARTLLDVVRRREIKKLEWLENSRKTFEIKFASFDLKNRKRRISNDIFGPNSDSSSESEESDANASESDSDPVPRPDYSILPKTTLLKKRPLPVRQKRSKRFKAR